MFPAPCLVRRAAHAAQLAVLCFVSATTASAQRDTILVARAQGTLVRVLDSSFAATALGDWITGLRPGVATRIRWEVNDCGEGGDGHAAPICVEAIVELAPDTTARLSVLMADLAGRPQRPAIFMLNAITENGILRFKTLAQWMAFVRTSR